MNTIKNIVSFVCAFIWVVLLSVLMIRLPISNMINGIDVPLIDIIISAIFCTLSVLFAVVGFVLKSKPLIALSLASTAMLVLSAVCFCLYVLFFNRDVLAIALRLANQFCAILLTPGFVYLSIYIVISIILPITAFVLVNKSLKK